MSGTLKPMQIRAEREREYMIGLRRALHRRPESSFEEYETAKMIESELDKLGIDHSRVGETGVLGVIRGRRSEHSGDLPSGGKAVILRADIDALRMKDEKDEPYRSENDAMHACGHDAHTAALLGAAKLLSEDVEAFSGEVRLFFQQAEEIGRGAAIFIKEGLLEGAERVLGIHMAPDLPVGRIGVRPGANNSSVDHFKIAVNGREAHVSTPQMGVDALYIAAQIVTGLQSVVSRQTDPMEPVVVGVGKLNAGTAYNIVAKNAFIEGTVRTLNPQLREWLKGRVTELAEQTAKMHGGTAEIEWLDNASPLINDREVCGEINDIVSSLWGEESLVTDRPPSLGGDDFADYLLRTPGAYVYIGSGNDTNPNTVSPLHSSRFDIDESAVIIAAALYAAYARSRMAGEV